VRSRVRRSAVAVVAVGFCVVVGLTGCADDAPSASDPRPSAEASASSEEGEPSVPSTSGSATAPAPASGRLVDAEVMTYRLPEGKWDLGSSGLTAIWTGDDVGDWVIVGTVGDAYDDTTLDDLAALTLEGEPDHEPPLRRAGTRTVGGVEGYVVEGSSRDGYYYEWGAVVGDHWVQLEFDLGADDARAEEWVESVLASVEWR
jgi:hypothetical protein